MLGASQVFNYVMDITSIMQLKEVVFPFTRLYQIELQIFVMITASLIQWRGNCQQSQIPLIVTVVVVNQLRLLQKIPYLAKLSDEPACDCKLVIFSFCKLDSVERLSIIAISKELVSLVLIFVIYK